MFLLVFVVVCVVMVLVDYKNVKFDVEGIVNFVILGIGDVFEVWVY